MGEFFNKVITYIKEHKAVGIIAGLLLLFVLFKKLKRGAPRRRRRKVLPRSVGMSKARRTNVNRIIKSGRNRGKKAWQIKGSEAARRHMAAIRRKRARKLF
jgi:hypothetical protein